MQDLRSVYGYTANKSFTEKSKTEANYPYGISKLQGEQSVISMTDENYSGLFLLDKGTVCGYKSRMRLDLVVNTMYKSAIENGTIKINNPKIWRPILSIKDANAYIKAITAKKTNIRNI